MITFTQKGSFKNTERYLAKLKSEQAFAILSKYGAIGVAALASATPKLTGEAAGSWGFTIKQGSGYHSIRWHNTHYVAGAPLVVLLQYGHGTGTGGYVQGRDFINPAMRPIFEKIANEVWKEVTSL